MTTADLSPTKSDLPRSTASLKAAHPRDLTLDLLKAFSIFLVVFFHNVQLNPASVADNIAMLLPSAAVPCFFMVSGALFFSRPFQMRRHLLRTIRFYLVVVAWKAVYLALYQQWGAQTGGSLRSLFAYLFLFQSLDGVGTAHFWFMEAMLTVMLAAPFLYLCFHADSSSAGGSRLLPGHSTLLVFVLAVLILFNQGIASGNLLLAAFSRMIGKPALEITQFGEINPLSFRYSNYMTFYLLGALLAEHKKQLSCRTAALLTGGGLLGLLLIKYIQTGSFLWNGLYLDSCYYWCSTMCLASGLFLLFSRLPAVSCRPLHWIAAGVGPCTLGIFYLHIPLLFLLTPAVFSHLTAWNGWLLSTVESLFIILLSLPIIWIGKQIPLIRELFH